MAAIVTYITFLSYCCEKEYQQEKMKTKEELQFLSLFVTQVRGKSWNALVISEVGGEDCGVRKRQVCFNFSQSQWHHPHLMKPSTGDTDTPPLSASFSGREMSCSHSRSGCSWVRLPLWHGDFISFLLSIQITSIMCDQGLTKVIFSLGVGIWIKLKLWGPVKPGPT